MSTRHLIANRKRKAISPVIATVMLVAVAVVIAAALAGFSGSLFGSYSSGPQVKIQTMELLPDGTGTVTMSNNGSGDDAVISVVVNNVGETATGSLVAPANVVAANSLPVDIAFTITVGGDGATAPTNLTSGQQVTAVIAMASGAQITQTITVA